MSDYKAVPFPPTAEMVEAAEDAYMPFGDMDLAIRMALLAAPAVQREPVGYIRKSALELMKSDELGVRANIIKEPRYPDCVAIYTAPQPAEQQPAPDVAGLAGKMARLIAAGNRLNAEAEECTYDDGMAEVAGSEYWCEFRDALEAATEAVAAYRKQLEGEA